MTGGSSSLAGRSLSLDARVRVEFGVGAVDRLPDVVVSAAPPDTRPRAFVVTDRGLRAAGVVDRVVDLLTAAGVHTQVHDGVAPNPSTDSVDQLAGAVRAVGPCVVVAVGGGSVLDAAKAVALLATNRATASDVLYHGPRRPGLPVVAVPTTAGTGAETNGFGVLEDVSGRRKVYLGDASVQPLACILDPALTVRLPAGATAATGMDALVHGIESLASRASSPLSAAYATEAVRLVGGSLPAAVCDGSDLQARSQLLMGSHLAGLALTLSGLGLVHGIAHAVTAHTGAAHGLALSAVLDEVMTRSLDVAAPAYARVAEALGTRVPGARGYGDDQRAAAEAAVGAVTRLADEVRARLRLGELGVDDTMLTALARGALADPVSRNHPRLFPVGEVEAVLVARR